MTEDNRVHFELDDLLHPAQAFSHPSEVVNDPDLTLNEKRAILASWASDACAIEAAPALRPAVKGGHVRFDEHHGSPAVSRYAGPGDSLSELGWGQNRKTRKDDDNDQGRPLQ